MIPVGAIAGSRRRGGGGGGATPHRYWRISVSTNDGNGDTSNTIVGEIEMRESPGGADVCTGGTPSQSSDPFGGSWVAANAYADDGDTTGSAFLLPGWTKYDFGASNEKAIVEVAIMGRNHGGQSLNQCFGDFDVQWSDDNSAWTTEWSVARFNNYVGDTFKVFTKP